MAPPFLALAGRPEDAVAQVRGLWRRLWLPGKRLLAHRWSDFRGRFAREAAWGVGNGWAAAGIVRTADHLPASIGAERDELRGLVREVLAGRLAHQRPDRLFHDVVDDPSTMSWR